MKIKLNKSLILERLKSAKNFSTDTELANFLDIKTSTLSNWYSRNSIDFDILFSKCENMPIEWLLTGKGEMLRENSNNTDVQQVKPDTNLVETIRQQAEQIGELKSENRHKNEQISALHKEVERLKNENTKLRDTLSNSTNKMLELSEYPKSIAADPPVTYGRNKSKKSENFLPHTP
jgi:predicted RNase H-like nuclease (RuvC/YqgF family)